MGSEPSFAFAEGRDHVVVTCEEVVGGAPVLLVARDGGGIWQFLCGAEHGDERPRMARLGVLVERDPTLNELADLGPEQIAEREGAGTPWSRTDETDAEIRAAVREHGWFIALFDDDGSGPGSRFGYSIGMSATLDHPEVVLIGRDPEQTAAVIEAIGQRARAGRPCPLDAPVEGLLDDRPCVLRPVDRAHYDDWLMHALRFHGGADFAAVQCVWPDDAGALPWEPGYALPPQRQADLTEPRR